jgi:hypothetical protein
MAVLFPIPEDAPVTTTVLPSRRFAIAEAIVRMEFGWVVNAKGDTGRDEAVKGDESRRSCPIDLEQARRCFMDC